MIDAAEKAGKISPGKTILIEPTSGNTGIACSRSSLQSREYKVILTDARNHEPGAPRHPIRLWAEIVLTPGPNGMKGAIAKANEILGKTPNGFIFQQFDNPANPAIHLKTLTGPEIWDVHRRPGRHPHLRRRHRRHHHRRRQLHQAW